MCYNLLRRDLDYTMFNYKHAFNQNFDKFLLNLDYTMFNYKPSTIPHFLQGISNLDYTMFNYKQGHTLIDTFCWSI